MGLTIGGEFSLFIDKYLAFDFGASVAHLGDFYGRDIPRGIFRSLVDFKSSFKMFRINGFKAVG